MAVIFGDDPDTGVFRVRAIPDADGVTAPCECGHTAAEHNGNVCEACVGCTEYRPQYPGKHRYELLPADVPVIV